MERGWDVQTFSGGLSKVSQIRLSHFFKSQRLNRLSHFISHGVVYRHSHPAPFIQERHNKHIVNIPFLSLVIMHAFQTPTIMPLPPPDEPSTPINDAQRARTRPFHHHIHPSPSLNRRRTHHLHHHHLHHRLLSRLPPYLYPRSSPAESHFEDRL